MKKTFKFLAVLAGSFLVAFLGISFFLAKAAVYYPNCSASINSCIDNCELGGTTHETCVPMCTGAYPNCTEWCDQTAYDYCFNDCQDIEDDEVRQECIDGCDSTYPTCQNCTDLLNECYSDCDGNVPCYSSCDLGYECEENCGAYTSCTDYCVNEQDNSRECLQECYTYWPDCSDQDYTCEENLGYCYEKYNGYPSYLEYCESQYDCAQECESFDLCNAYCAENEDNSESCTSLCSSYWPECGEDVSCEEYLNDCYASCEGEPYCLYSCEYEYPECVQECSAWWDCSSWCETYSSSEEEFSSCQKECDIYWPVCSEDTCEEEVANCYTECSGNADCIYNCQYTYNCTDECDGYENCSNYCEKYYEGETEVCMFSCEEYWPYCGDEDTCEETLNECYNYCYGSQTCLDYCTGQNPACSNPCDPWTACYSYCDEFSEIRSKYSEAPEYNQQTCYETCDNTYPECGRDDEYTCEELLSECYTYCEGNPNCYEACSTDYRCEDNPCDDWLECKNWCQYDEENEYECLLYCDNNFPECSPCSCTDDEDICDESEMQSMQICLNYCVLDENIEGCEDICYAGNPECPKQDNYEECYDGCFTDDNADTGVDCVCGCQNDNPSAEYQIPYDLQTPRCFEEINFFDYVDVPYTNWSWSAVNLLTRLEIKEGSGNGPNSETFHSRIIRGYNRDDEDDGEFKPGESIDEFKPVRNLNRFEAAKIATLIACYTIPDYTSDISKTHIFTDVDPNSDEYLNRVVYRAAELNLLSGFGDGAFKPMEPITRAEFLKVLLTVAGFHVNSQSYPASGFNDVTDPSIWYYNYVAFANNLPVPIISGYDDGSFRPSNPINRDEAMIIIVKTMLNLDWISRAR